MLCTIMILSILTVSIKAIAMYWACTGHTQFDTQFDLPFNDLVLAQLICV